jgi:hypothetical protein
MPNINIPQGAVVIVFLDPNRLQCRIAPGEIKYFADYLFHVGNNKLFFFKSRSTKDEVVGTAITLTESGLTLAVE